MKWLTLVLFSVMALQSQATVMSSHHLCSEEFQGRVKELIEEVGPDSAFALQKVVFENELTLKGNVEELVAIEMLKNGPFKLEPGKDYRVLLRKGKLCWIEEI